MTITRHAGLGLVVRMRWVAFELAAAGSDQAARHGATLALARLLITTSTGGGSEAIGIDQLSRLLAAIDRVITELRHDGEKNAEAEVRHELALLLRLYAAVLPGRPLRKAIFQELQALRLFRGVASSLFVGRVHHVIGLAARDAGYTHGVRDRERALVHLERARRSFQDVGRPDLAANSAFSAMDAWADRRIGDRAENFSIARFSWQECRRLFRQAGVPIRAFACDIAFAQCLFRRRYQRSEAFDELIDLLGGVVNALAELPAYPEGSPEDASRRRLFADALSLLGATHGARPGRARFRKQMSECFRALPQLLDKDDPPAFLATHCLRFASYALAEARSGRMTLVGAEKAISGAVDASRLSGEPAKQLAADYLAAQILAEAGRYDESLALFRAVAGRWPGGAMPWRPA